MGFTSLALAVLEGKRGRGKGPPKLCRLGIYKLESQATVFKSHTDWMQILHITCQQCIPWMFYYNFDDRKQFGRENPSLYN